MTKIIFKGALINAVFLISVCFGMLVEAIERLFEKKHIHDPKLLLLVGCIGLAINLIGLFIFGHSHSHSHSLPSHKHDNEPEEGIKLIIAETDLSKSENPADDKNNNSPDTGEKIVHMQSSSNNSDQTKKKTTKCHILCKS
jgi:Co/Zn/Cd efflux system component